MVNISENIKRDLVWSVQNALSEAGFDIKNQNTGICNRRAYTISDYIYKNFKNSFLNKQYEVPIFQRRLWKGFLLVDFTNHYTINIMKETTFLSLKPKDTLHYLQTLVKILNSRIPICDSVLNQTSLFEPIKYETPYLESDFLKITNGIVNPNEFTHLVLLYREEKFQLTNAEIRVLDINMGTYEILSLNEFIKIEYDIDYIPNKNVEKEHDSNDLISLADENLEEILSIKGNEENDIKIS